VLERLVNPLPSGLTLGLMACLVCGAAGAGIGYGFGFRHAAALGTADLKTLEAEHAEQALAAASESRVRLLQQVERANQAEALMLAERDRHAEQVQQLQERIPHVTTTYRPTAAAAPVAIPHCVFTVGWLRDYNTAIGVPGAATGPVASHAGQAPWAAAGTDAELLESGVSPADILAHAQDYGRWARNAASQVTALLNTKEGCTP
jgi:hypothetical protein